MKLSERIDSNIWVSIDGELQQLRPLVAQLEAENERLRGERKQIVGVLDTYGIGEERQIISMIATTLVPLTQEQGDPTLTTLGEIAAKHHGITQEQDDVS